MGASRLVRRYEESMPWLKGIIGRVQEVPLNLYCHHNEMISICGQCGPYAVEKYKEYKLEQERT